MTDERYTFRIPKYVALMHIQAKGEAERAQGYKPITWTEWFQNDPRVKPDAYIVTERTVRKSLGLKEEQK